MSDAQRSQSGVRADPLALGLAAYGVTMTFFNLTNSGLVPADGELVALPMGLVFGVVGFIAAFFMYRLGSTFWMVAFVTINAFWWWVALVHVYVDIGWAHWDGLDSTLGVASVMWAALAFMLWISTFRMPKIFFFMFLTLWVLFACGAVSFLLGGYKNGTDLRHVGCYFGIISGLLGMYASFALITNSTFGRTVIPLGARSFIGAAS